MGDNSALNLLNTVKSIVDNYLNNRKVTTMVIGTFNGSVILLSDNLPLPLSMVFGNLKERLVSGDKVRLLRSDGGREYYVLEIIEKPMAFLSDLS